MKVKIFNSYIYFIFEKIDNEEKQLNNSLERVRNIIHNIENNMVSYKYAILKDIVDYYFNDSKSIPHYIFIVNDKNEFVIGVDYNPRFNDITPTSINRKIRIYNKKVSELDYADNDTSINVTEFNDKDTSCDDFMKKVLHK